MSRPGAPVHRVAVLLLAALLAVLAGSAPASAAWTHPETGPGVVEGVVRDTTGAPVADAHVSVYTNTRSPEDGSWLGHDRFAQTDADGHYRLDGIVLPNTPWQDDDHVLVAGKVGFADDAPAGVARSLSHWDGTPIHVDAVLRRKDVVLRGRLSVRDGGSPAGGKVTATLAERPGFTPAPGDHWDTEADADGRWELQVPAGSYRISAQSTYGLKTSWPDLASVRPAPTTAVAAPGDVLSGLDISMRLRLPGMAWDEFGTLWSGWADDPVTGRSSSGTIGQYPRDTYRSVTSPNGPAVRVGALRSSSPAMPRLPTDELITITGVGVPVEVPIENTGDDVLWLGDVRVEGAHEAGSSCQDEARRPCPGRWLMPGETTKLLITPVTDAYAAEYRLTVVVPTNAGPDTRVLLRLRNVADPTLGPNDVNILGALLPYLSPEAEAEAILLGAPGPWQLRHPAPAAAHAVAAPATPGLGVVVVRRSSVRAVFPVAGRIDVRIDRRIPARGRAKARWSTTRSLTLRAPRAGTRTARIRTLARGRYRVRAAARFGAGHLQRTTAVRTVRR